MARPRIAELMARLTPQRLAAAVGPACARATQRHLLALGQNKKGWPTTHFWSRAAKATSWQALEDGVVVSINQIGARQRYHGGHIAPVTKRALTIPISPVAYGHTASEFPGSFLLKTTNGAYIVQHGEEVGGGTSKAARAKFNRGRGGNASKRIKASLNFLFKLSTGVDQEPNPEVLPSHEEMAAVAVAAIQRAVRA